MVEVFENCVSVFSVLLGLITGSLFGFLFYCFVKMKDSDNLNLSNFLEVKSNTSFCKKNKNFWTKIRLFEVIFVTLFAIMFRVIEQNRKSFQKTRLNTFSPYARANGFNSFN